MATSVGDVSQTAGRPAQRADPPAVRHGPILIGYDGAAGSETRRFIREAPCPTLVVGERPGR